MVHLELACWQPLEGILALGNPHVLDDSSLSGIKTRLLSESVHLESVGASAGARFKSATRSCLAGSSAFGIDEFDNEADRRVSAKLSHNFYHKVIVTLEEIQT